MSSFFFKSSKIGIRDSNDYSSPLPKVSKKPKPQNIIDCEIFNNKSAAVHDPYVHDVSCVEECKKETKNNDIWQQCLKKVEKKGGKRKSKKYRNKKNKTKRKRSYSSKKT